MLHKDSTEMKAFLAGFSELQSPEKVRDLYSGFRRPREVNPEAFDNKIKFWEQVITKAVDLGLLGRSYFCTPESNILEDALRYENLRPEGLSCVLRQMVWGNKAKPLKRVPSQSLISQTFNFIKSFFIESEDSCTENELPHGPIIVTTLLEQFTTRFVQYIFSKDHCNDLTLRCLGDRKDFEELVNRCRIHYNQKPLHAASDFDLILDSIKKQDFVSVAVEDGWEYIRFKQRSQVSFNITAEEVNLLKLKKCLCHIDELISSQSKQVRKERERVKIALADGNRNYALQCARRVKSLEKNINAKLEARNNVLNMVDSIEGLFENKTVLQAYDLGNATLKQVLQDSSISAEKVNEVLLESTALLNEVSGISEAIASLDLQDHDEDLEAELEEIKSELASADSYPSVPESKPIISKEVEIHDEVVHKELVNE